MELQEERKLLQETRAELRALVVALEPLLEMAKMLKVVSADLDDSEGADPSTFTQPDLPDPPVKDDPEMQKLLDAGIKELGKNRFRLRKSLLDKWIGNPKALASSARLVPIVKDGKPFGLKIYAIRPSSILDRFGLKNGDTLVRINGGELTSPDKVLEAYSNLSRASTLKVEFERAGKPQVIAIWVK